MRGGGAPCGEITEEQAGEERGSGGEQEGSEIEVSFGDAGNALGRKMDEQVHTQRER